MLSQLDEQDPETEVSGHAESRRRTGTQTCTANPPRTIADLPVTRNSFNHTSDLPALPSKRTH
jgi:hypothetical protein